MQAPPTPLRPLLLSRWKLVVLTLLNVLVSASLGIAVYPRKGWYLCAAMGSVSAASLLLRCGWVVPCTIAGVYFGLLFLDPPVKGGTAESQMYETVGNIFVGTILGLGVGLFLDLFGKRDVQLLPPIQQPRGEQPPP